MKERKYRTIPATGIERRISAIKPNVHERSDEEMIQVLFDLARARNMEVLECAFDRVRCQGVANEAESLRLIAERFKELLESIPVVDTTSE